MNLEHIKGYEGYLYLATPYSKYPHGVEQAAIDACRVAAELIKAGIPVFCPIAHSHSIADIGDIDPLDHNIWLPADKPLMDGATAIVVAMMDGWDKSYGVAEEIKVFQNAGKRVIYLEVSQWLT